MVFSQILCTNSTAQQSNLRGRTLLVCAPKRLSKKVLEASKRLYYIGTHRFHGKKSHILASQGLYFIHMQEWRRPHLKSGWVNRKPQNRQPHEIVFTLTSLISVQLLITCRQEKFPKLTKRVGSINHVGRKNSQNKISVQVGFFSEIGLQLCVNQIV